jgi:hypothetical protein
MVAALSIMGSSYLKLTFLKSNFLLKTLTEPLSCESKGQHKKENTITINQPSYGVTNTLSLASLYPVYVTASLRDE